MIFQRLYSFSAWEITLEIIAKIAKPLKPDFPNVVEETERLLARKNLSPQNEWLILREQLASIKRQGLIDKQDISELFKKYVRLRELFNPDFQYINHLNAPLDDDVTNLGYDLVKAIEALRGDERQKIFNETLGDKDIKDLEWELDGTIASTMAYFIQIDLLEGRIYVNGYSPIDTLPEKFANADRFEVCFGKKSSITNIASRGPDVITFKDAFGYTCFSKMISSSSEPINQKIINGELCLNEEWQHTHKHFYYYMTKTCTVWHSSVEPHQVYFLDRKSGQLRYIYNPKLDEFKCVDGPCKGLYLVDPEVHKSKTNVQLRNFDPSAMIWRNKEGRVEIVELPQYGIRFNAEWTVDGCRLNAGRPYEGFFLADFASIPSLPWYKNCLILQNDEGEQRVLIPKLGVDRLHFRLWRTSTDAKNIMSMYIDEFGNLDASDNLEAQIYLAYIYNEGRDYEKALALLSRASMMPPRAYTEHELNIFGWITHNISGNHFDDYALKYDTPQALAR